MLNLTVLTYACHFYTHWGPGHSESPHVLNVLTKVLMGLSWANETVTKVASVCVFDHRICVNNGSVVGQTLSNVSQVWNHLPISLAGNLIAAQMWASLWTVSFDVEKEKLRKRAFFFWKHQWWINVAYRPIRVHKAKWGVVNRFFFFNVSVKRN